MKSKRLEASKEVAGPGGKGGGEAYVTNVVSDFLLANSLSYQVNKIGAITDSVSKEIGKAFAHVKIFICCEDPRNLRMRFFQSHRGVIFIPDLKDSEIKDAAIINFINNVFRRDYSLRNKEQYCSEIAVPLLYRTKLPFGYIQVNGTESLTESSLGALKKVAMRIMTMFSRDNIFPKFEDKFRVTNIAKEEFTINVKDKNFIRSFKENSNVYLDMVLPGNKKASILAVERNINVQENNSVSIVFQIVDIDALSEVYYEEYLDSASF